MAQRFDLGILDKYPIAVKGTSIEDSPTVGAVLDETVDPERLHAALGQALALYPLFKTRIVFDKEYFLEENNEPVLIFHENDLDRTFTWKTGTNGYPWKLSYFGDRVLLRWCHTVTDGRGAEAFLGAVLSFYYGVPHAVEPALGLGLEAFADKHEKGLPQKKQAKGFGKKGLKIAPSDESVQCHVLKCRTADILALAKRNDASPATVIPPMFSMALRKCMKAKKNVKFGIVIDARVPMGYATMHNCIFTKEITYTDRYDSMDFELVSTIYRAILNLACEKENVAVVSTSMVGNIGLIVNRKTKAIIRLGGKLCAAFMKNGTTDATFTYLGKVDYGPEVNKHLRDYLFASWTDFGCCNIAASDLGGEFTMMVNESYQDKNVIPAFLQIAESLGVKISEVDSYRYFRGDR